MEIFLRWFLPLYLVAYLMTAFLWRSSMTWKKTGVNPYVLGRTESTHDFVGMLFRLTLGLIVGVVMLFAVAPHWYVYVTPIPWLQSSILVVTGLVFLLGSLTWILIAQMGHAWRIGIDKRHETPLIQHGLFTVSRNPIFLGMRLTLLDIFLAHGMHNEIFS